MEPETSSTRSGLQVVTFNCRSIKSSIGTVKQLCKSNDIVFIQEHWLLPGDISYLSSIDNDFIAFGSSAVDINCNILSGRPYGGTAILCRRTLAACAKVVNSNNNRITAVELTISVNKVLTSILLASVYMPVDTGYYSDEDFEFICGCLDALIADSHVTGYIFAGDFNFGLHSPRYDFINNSLAKHHIVMADQCLLDANSFTYVSDCHNTTSWIDHVFVNYSLLQLIDDMSVDYGSVSSDHRPIQFSLNAVVDCPNQAANVGKNADIDGITMSDWNACTQADLINYAFGLDELLSATSMPSLCCVHNCTNPSHKNDINEYLTTITRCIKDSMQRLIPSKKCRVSEYSVAGWNDLVSDKHEVARDAFLEWTNTGKPRSGYIYELMKRTRAQFKLALRYCKNNAEMLRSNALAKSYLTDQTNFWKKVKNVSNSRASNSACTINGTKGDVPIAEMWKESFEKLYSMHSNDGLLTEFSQYNTDIVHTVMYSDVCNAVQRLKLHKSCGPDGIPAEAIKHAGHLLSVHLTLFFNMCLCHCYIPDELIKTTVVPLLKNKSGDISDINNYRAIALSNCLSKLLESLMLSCFQSYDSSEDIYQFGFRKDHSTSLGCAVLKRVIDYYRLNGSYVFACFLDLSKAFDSVNHVSLFKKITALKFPANMVKLLIYWYSNQQINVQWKCVVTSSFYMKNGTRQGSVLSPYLFSIYMRSITDNVVNSGIGCYIGGMPVCMLLYADDLVILAPSWFAQQRLLDICVKSVECLDMKFNASKSMTMIFAPYRSVRRVSYAFPSLMLNGCMLNIVESCKYLGFVISSVSDDNVDMIRQMGLLYGRANVLIRKFSRCSRNVKLCLFRAHCVQFYGAALWERFNVSVMRRFEAAYVKCVKMFFGFSRRDSVTAMFCELGLPTFSTVVHNAEFRLKSSVKQHVNELVKHVFLICT